MSRIERRMHELSFKSVWGLFQSVEAGSARGGFALGMIVLQTDKSLHKGPGMHVLDPPNASVRVHCMSIWLNGYIGSSITCSMLSSTAESTTCAFECTVDANISLCRSCIAVPASLETTLHSPLNSPPNQVDSHVLIIPTHAPKIETCSLPIAPDHRVPSALVHVLVDNTHQATSKPTEFETCPWLFVPCGVNLDGWKPRQFERHGARWLGAKRSRKHQRQ